jgi:hypothetical protein
LCLTGGVFKLVLYSLFLSRILFEAEADDDDDDAFNYIF